MNKKPLEQIENVTNVTGYRQVSLWKREDLQHPQPDELAEEVPVALVYNGISHVVMMASPKDLEQFAVGFSLSEGIIEHRREIFGMDVVAVCNGLECRLGSPAGVLWASKPGVARWLGAPAAAYASSSSMILVSRFSRCRSLSRSI